MTSIRYACPCCGYLTLLESPPGTYAICSVCFWEDDAIQFEDPSYSGGANQISLQEARENFRRFGAVAEGCINQVRPPHPEEIP